MYIDAKRAILLFVIATIPPYFSLLAFGYDGDKLQVPLITGGVLTVLLCWLVAYIDSRKVPKKSTLNDKAS